MTAFTTDDAKSIWTCTRCGVDFRKEGYHIHRSPLKVNNNKTMSDVELQDAPENEEELDEVEDSEEESEEESEDEE